MSSTIQSHRQHIFVKSAKIENIKANLISCFLKNAEQKRFRLILLLLSAIGCIGSIEATCAITDSWIKLRDVAFCAPISLVMLSSVAPLLYLLVLESRQFRFSNSLK